MSVRKTTTKAAVEAAAVKTTPAKTEETKIETAAKKAPVKRGAAKKEAAAKKATATKTRTAKTTPAAAKESVFLQFAGKELDTEIIKANVRKAWVAETGKKESDIKDVQIYVKPEENAAYYVVNGEFVEGGRKIDL